LDGPGRAGRAGDAGQHPVADGGLQSARLRDAGDDGHRRLSAGRCGGRPAEPRRSEQLHLHRLHARRVPSSAVAMATIPRTTFGPGGFDPAKPNANVVDTGMVAVPDPPADLPPALVVLRNIVTGQGAQPTTAQAISAL